MELIRKYKQGKLTTTDLRRLNNVVIWLMVLVAATSIFWSISIHILSGDFYNNIIGAKITFRTRDFAAMDERAKHIFYEDLGVLINESYSHRLVDDADASEVPSAEKRIMLDETANLNQSSTTKQPKVRKIPHLFRISSNRYFEEEDGDESDQINTTTAVPIGKIDTQRDIEFLSSRTIDIHQTRWSQSTAVQFIHSFPFLSEVIAIVWSAMCLLYQTSVKKYWGVPKPWRIVLPSIVIFTLMAVGSLVYTIFATRYLKTLCTDLKRELTDPNAISCGQAMSVLRPVIRQHEFSHDMYLNLFRISYLLALALWVIAFLIMTLRYIFAIDFQVVDVKPMYESKVPQTERACKKKEPSGQSLDVEGQKSEDDFQSAKSHLSDVAVPLLEPHQQKVV